MAQVRRATRMPRVKRREQLLAVAKEIIAQEGLAALTMGRLAERANVAKPVVYDHFVDRDAVAITLLYEHGRAIRAFFEARLNTANTLRDYVSGVVEAAFIFDRVNDTPVRKITNGFSAGDAINQVFLRDEAEFRRHWKRLLLLLNVPDERAEIVAPLLSGLVNGAVCAFANQDDATLAKATVTQLLLDALAAFAHGPHDAEAILPNFRDVIAQVYEITPASPPLHT